MCKLWVATVRTLSLINYIVFLLKACSLTRRDRKKNARTYTETASSTTVGCLNHTNCLCILFLFILPILPDSESRSPHRSQSMINVARVSPFFPYIYIYIYISPFPSANSLSIRPGFSDTKFFPDSRIELPDFIFVLLASYSFLYFPTTGSQTGRIRRNVYSKGESPHWKPRFVRICWGVSFFRT